MSEFVKKSAINDCEIEKIMLKLIEFHHKHHPSGVKCGKNLLVVEIPVIVR